MTTKTPTSGKKAAVKAAAKKAAAKAPAKKAAAKAPAKKAARALAKKGPMGRAGGFSTYVGAALKKAPAGESYKAPAKTRSGARRSEPRGTFVVGGQERKPNATTLAALAEVGQLVAAFKKRHGVS
jgi:DNA-binding protein HU-beta